MDVNRDVRNAIDVLVRWAVSMAVYDAVYPGLEEDTARALGEFIVGGRGPTMSVYYDPPHPAICDFLLDVGNGAM
jgi:hypothetical protein